MNSVQKKSPVIDKTITHLPNFLKKMLGIYPRIVRSEIRTVKKVLRSRQWNMGYGSNPVHQKFEEKFGEYVGSNYAVAFGTGGVAMQTLFRALNLKMYSELLLQVDTCSASAQAILNVNLIPHFYDINMENFMLDNPAINQIPSPSNLSAILATHMWGNSENIGYLKGEAEKNGVLLIEDACLAFGSRIGKKHVGTFGVAGIFSTGSTKPFQTGEGGIIVTDDKNLAETLVEMRGWGDHLPKTNMSNFDKLSYNGRMSEIVAGIGYEQLLGYPSRLEKIQLNFQYFYNQIQDVDELRVVLGIDQNIESNAFSQVVLSIDETKVNKKIFREILNRNGIFNSDANFRPINTMDYFRQQKYKDKMPYEIANRLDDITSTEFINASKVYRDKGIGLSRINFESSFRVKSLVKNIKSAISDLYK